MKIYRWMRDCGLAALGVGALSFGSCQVAGALNLSRPDVDCSSPRRSNNFSCRARDFVREIDDAGSGLCWTLLRDESHPGGPGRLVLNASRDGAKETQSRGSALDRDSDRESQQVIDSSRRIVIRTGDHLIVQEQTSRSDLELEGTALAPAAAGEALHVRLRFGGWTVRAIAVKSGQATLAPRAEVRQ
jgi:hypothetical protein